MQKITPCLWYDKDAAEAAALYVDVFNSAPGNRKKSRVGKESKYGEAGAEVSGQKKGSTMIVEFELDGQKFIALNGGPLFKFTEAVSFTINCETQEEVDHFWNRLTEGGAESQCGWLRDKFGLSWQITPTLLTKLIDDPDPVKANRVMQAMIKMSKIDIAATQKAYDGK